MLSKIIMPPGGQTTNESIITKWHKKVGDKIERGDILFEIETDKATLQIESYAAGNLLATYCDEGDKINTGTVVAYVGNAGDKVPEDAVIAEDTENNDNAEVTAGDSNPYSERPSKIDNKKANKIEVNDDDEDKKGLNMNSDINVESDEDEEDDEYTPIVKSEKHEIPSSGTASGNDGKADSMNFQHLATQATPKARKTANETGKDIRQIFSQLTRVVKNEDVVNYDGSAGTYKINVASTVQPLNTNTVISRESEDNLNSAGKDSSRPFYFIKTTGMRKAIANKMCKSVNTSPQYTVSMEMNMTKAISFRSIINERAAKDGVRISFNDIIMKAVAMAIAKFPLINSLYGEDEIKIHNSINIGLAVGIEGGLVVPVIKDVQSKPLSVVSAESSNAVKSVKSPSYDKKILSGGTITLSNLGMYGVTNFTAILNEPESCILAIGGIEQKAVIQNGSAIAIPVMNITATFDHRVIDGSYGAQFLKEVKTILENPELLAY